MNERDEYIAECADYLRELATRSLYSDENTAAVLMHLENAAAGIRAALKASRSLSAMNAAPIETVWTEGRKDPRTYGTGLPAALPSALHSQLSRSLALVRQGIADTEAHRASSQPDNHYQRYKLKRAAVNLAAGYFERPTPKPVETLAAAILAAAGEDNQLPTRTVKDWLRKLREGNLTG